MPGRFVWNGIILAAFGTQPRLGHADPDPLDAARIGIRHLELDAVLDNDFTAHRNMPSKRGDQPSQSINLLGVADRCEISLDRPGHFAQGSARASTRKPPPAAASIFGLSS